MVTDIKNGIDEGILAQFGRELMQGEEEIIRIHGYPKFSVGQIVQFSDRKSKVGRGTVPFVITKLLWSHTFGHWSYLTPYSFYQSEIDLEAI